MEFDEILYWLRENDSERLEILWKRADALRRDNVGDSVYLRGLVEISNLCRRNCLYCGIRAENRSVERYRMTKTEILDTARLAKRLGYGTLVVQSGEDFGIRAEEIAEIVRQIKSETELAITLSLGERSEADYRLWFDAGADRYLLRFETSNRQLFDAIHPPTPGEEPRDRLHILKVLRGIGYEIGSGVMSGIPGQSLSDLAGDIKLFAELDLDMIGCGPFLPHPETPLGRTFDADPTLRDEHLPFKVIALARLVCPKANIPSTTAVATIDPKRGRLLGLSRGANVVMPNLTPTKYRKMYEIYPNKAASFESPEETHGTAVRQIEELGRTVGRGAGTSPGFSRRTRFVVETPEN